jgi:hypothetical protein
MLEQGVAHRTSTIVWWWRLFASWRNSAAPSLCLTGIEVPARPSTIKLSARDLDRFVPIRASWYKS